MTGQVLATATVSSASGNPNTADTLYTEIEIERRELEQEIFLAQRRIDKAISDLPPKIRRVIRMRRRGRTLQQISNQTGFSTSTVAGQEEAGRVALRKTLSRADVELLIRQTENVDSLIESVSHADKYEDIGPEFADRADRLRSDQSIFSLPTGMRVKINPDKLSKHAAFLDKREDSPGIGFLKGSTPHVR